MPQSAGFGAIGRVWLDTKAVTVMRVQNLCMQLSCLSALSRPKLSLMLAPVVLTFWTSVARAADPYADALGQLVGATLGLVVASNNCGNAFPELQPGLTTGMADWRQRNARTLAEIDLRWNSLRKEMSSGDSERDAELARQLEAQTREAEEATTAQMERLPPQRLQAFCSALPQSLSSLDRDLEVAMKSQLQSVRKLRPSP